MPDIEDQFTVSRRRANQLPAVRPSRNCAVHRVASLPPQPLPCSSHGFVSASRLAPEISPRVPSPIHFPPNPFYRWGRMPSYRPRRTSQPIFRRAEAPWFVGLPLPTEVTLFRIPPRVNTFLWPSFAPRSPQGGVVSKDSLLAARQPTQRGRGRRLPSTPSCAEPGITL